MSNGKITDTIYRIDAKVFGLNNFTSVYLIKGEKSAIIDSGANVSAPFILNGMKKYGFDPNNISYIIITHIHLDHGGGAGTLIKEMPKAKVVVHGNGAMHMIDPSKLVNSSKRVFGDRIDEWYGDVLPIREDRIIPIKDGETIDLGKGQVLSMIDSPGHANHHICVYSEKEKVLFTGDAAGVYIPNAEVVIPTTPPPEFDPDININTIKGFLGLDLKRLLFSHFGSVRRVSETLNSSIDWLLKWKNTTSEIMSRGGSLEEIIEKFRADTREALGSSKGAGSFYNWVMEHHIPMCAFGYFNYFDKKAE